MSLPNLGLKPTGVAAAAGAVDGFLVAHDRNNPGGVSVLLGASPLLVYRLLLAATGVILVGFTQIDDEVATSVMVAGGYGLSSSLGSRLVKGSQKLASGAGFLVPPVFQPYVTADGRFRQGPPDPADAPALRVAALLTPGASLRGYGREQVAGYIA